jgi:glycosyltransferase involved in cell wall biosynthesis
MPRKLRILTWHVHGNYLWYLSQARHEFYLPVRSENHPGYGGRGRTFPFGDNVIDVPAEEVRRRQFDCILYQASANYETDQYEILSPAQRRLPRIYLEHDPPQQHPTNTRHWVDDPDMLLVHVTHFNRLMWDSGRTPTRVIEHGVLAPENVRYSGELPRGVVVINHLLQRGRRLGADVFVEAAADVPLDLVGMASEDLGGFGEIPPPQLGQFIARYRFFFNPIRYTSLGLAVCEAMTIGLPIVALATTENVTVIRNGVSGWLDTDLSKLVGHMRRLLRDPAEAQALGAAARQEALRRFDIRRFVSDWEQTLAEVAGSERAPHRMHDNSESAHSTLQETLA